MTITATTPDLQIVRFAPWEDPNVPTVFHCASEPALIFLTPTLGPTATLLLYQVALELHQQGDRAFITTTTPELSARLGVKPSVINQSIGRLVRFGYASMVYGGIIDIRVEAPPIPGRHIRRWPTELQHLYRDHLAGLTALHLPPDTEDNR